MSILEFNTMKKRDRLRETTVRALRGVDLTVGKGECITVPGVLWRGERNDSGKGGAACHA